jgi:hypothetical protein
MYSSTPVGPFQTPAAWPPMTWRTCVPARQRQHLHAPYQICYLFWEIIKKYRRGDVRQIPGEYAGPYTPLAVLNLAQLYACVLSLYTLYSCMVGLASPPLEHTAVQVYSYIRTYWVYHTFFWKNRWYTYHVPFAGRVVCIRLFLGYILNK